VFSVVLRPEGLRKLSPGFNPGLCPQLGQRREKLRSMVSMTQAGSLCYIALLRVER
jgi:hypothetical protein